MNYPPNTDAARYLITVILPLIKQTVPDVKVLIVGHSPTPDLIELGKQPGVTVTGFVDDMRPYLEQASIFVAPLRFGAGIQNKLLEALAMELPVIASPLAADGMRTEDGECAFVQTADTPQQYATLITTQLRQDAASVSGAREFIKSHFIWKRSGEQLEQIFKNVVGRR
jgi:glycosyltransferase involved in cell wall biosynthesis